MAFESLSSKLQATIKRLKGQTRVTEKDVKEFMREIRLALLEADVNYKVVKDFIAKVSEKAVGQEVLESLSPGQQIVKIVDDELTELLGAEDYKLDLSKTPPNVIMMVGLQGTGKTTATAKLAAHLRKQGRKPLMAACDIYRPAAIQQLQVLGKQIDIPVYAEGTDVKAANIAKNAIKYAIQDGEDIYLISITAEESDGILEICVQDDGKGIPPERLAEIRSDLEKKGMESTSSIGLKNVHSRIQITYGEQYGIRIQSREHVGTNVRILCPAILGKEGDEK
jgi:signal transduction histidine kinase